MFKVANYFVCFSAHDVDILAKIETAVKYVHNQQMMKKRARYLKPTLIGSVVNCIYDLIGY